MTDWPAWVGVVGGGMGAVGGGAGVVAAVAGWRAVTAAKDSAAAAAELSRLEADRRHEDLDPCRYLDVSAPFVYADNSLRQLIVFMEMPRRQVTRSYRVRGTVNGPPGVTWEPSYMPPLIHPGQNLEILLERLAPDQAEPSAVSLYMRFWPPHADDGVTRWTCPCLAVPADPAAGHWERTVTIDYQLRPQRPRALYCEATNPDD